MEGKVKGEVERERERVGNNVDRRASWVSD